MCATGKVGNALDTHLEAREHVFAAMLRGALRFVSVFGRYRIAIFAGWSAAHPF